MSDDTPAPKPHRRGRKLYADAALRDQRGFTPDKQAEYLTLLSERVPPSDAAKMAGVSMNSVRQHRAKDPAFVEAETQARSDSAAPFVKRVYELAMDGHMTALLFVLQNLDPDNWKDMRQVSKTVKHSGTVTHELEPGQQMAKIMELQARLVERAELTAPVIDVEADPE